MHANSHMRLAELRIILQRLKKKMGSLTRSSFGAILCLLSLSTLVCATPVSFGPITVPGNAVIFDPGSVLSASTLAGLGSNGSLGAVPAILAATFNLGTVQSFTFSASGEVGCCSSINIGPDGYSGTSDINSLLSISGYDGPPLALVGVFTNGSLYGSAPAAYSYSSGVGQLSYSTVLDQVFFIGDGLTGTGTGSTQTFYVAAGATELWLGFADAAGFTGSPGDYGDNPGSLTVSGTLTTNTEPCVPEPLSGLLVGLGLTALSLIRRR